MAGKQSFTLLKIYRSQPVAISHISTALPEVDLPSVTVCAIDEPQPGKEEDKPPVNGSHVAHSWRKGLSLTRLVVACHPDCTPERDIDYPGGQVDVTIGRWRSWVDASDDALCHTLITNTTWGGPPRTREVSLQLTAREEGVRIWTHRVVVHPRRRVIGDGRGMRPDNAFTLRRPRSSSTLEIQSDISEKIDRHDFPCVNDRQYDFMGCRIACFDKLFADKFNCSTSDMIEAFPELSECPHSVDITRMRTDISEEINQCPCPIGCFGRRLKATITFTECVKEDYNVTSLSIRAAQPPQEHSKESLTYPTESFLSEAGGYFSLLLGVSALSIFDWVMSAAQRCRRAGAVTSLRGWWTVSPASLKAPPAVDDPVSGIQPPGSEDTLSGSGGEEGLSKVAC